MKIVATLVGIYLVLLVLKIALANIFYVFGIILAGAACFCAYLTLEACREYKMSDEKYLEQKRQEAINKATGDNAPVFDETEVLNKKSGKVTIVCCLAISLFLFYGANKSIGHQSIYESEIEQEEIAEKNAVANEKITAMNDEEKVLYEQKFAEYTQTMDETSAREKAIADVEADTSAKNKALQEMYDKQEQYEKWLAQKEEQERKVQEKAAEEQRKAQEKAAEEQRRKENSYWLVTRYGGKQHIEGEKYIGDWKDEHRGEIVAIYYIPSTKIRDDVDYILGKDPGYSVDVVEKIGGKPQKCITYHFKKSSNGWEWKIKRLLEIHDISQRNDLSEAEQKYKIPISEIPAGEKFYYYDKDPDASHNDHGDWYDIGGSNLATYVFNATHSTADDIKK